MTTIPDYPPLARPLDGTEPLPIWQDGQQRASSASEVADFVGARIVADVEEAGSVIVADATEQAREAAASRGAAEEAARAASQGGATLMPGVSTTGTPLYVYDNYGLGDPLHEVMAAQMGMVLGRSASGAAVYSFDDYGLGDELGASVSADVVPGALFNADAIRAWHTHAQGARFRGEQAVVAIVADSQYAFGNGRAAVPLTQRMRAAYGNGGPGWCSPEGSALPYDPSYTGGEVVFGGSGFAGAASATSPNQRVFASSTAGNTTTLTYGGASPIATLDLHHAGGGTISYSYGGAATQVAFDPAPGKVRLAAPPQAGQWTLTITVVSGAVTLAGYDLRTGKGAVVHNLAIPGTTAQQWAAADQAAWRAALSRLAPDAVLFSLGGNDELNNRSADQVAADILTLLASARATNPSVDAIVSMRPQTYRSAGVTPMIADYAATMRARAITSRFAFYDAARRFGTAPAQYSYAPTGTDFVALQSDNLHFNQLGADIFVSGPCELLDA